MKSEAILTVPLKAVRRDVNQPRKVFDQAKIEELAQSIKSRGQRLPAEVRPLDKDDPDRKKGVEYELISGERRLRACELGKVPTFRIIVSAVDDKEKFALQLIENQQRENLSALEEAQAYQEEIAKRKTQDPKFSPEDLAKEIGQSRATVYERLKLTRLHPPVRAALVAGKISTSIAGRIATVPDPKEQERLLKEVLDALQYDNVSVRDVDRWIDGDFSKPLGGAPFDPKETYTGDVKLQGATLMLFHRGPCTTCKFRSGNMLEEFPELKNRPNVCTQPACYEGKVKAATLLRVQKANAAGQPTLTEAEFAKTKGQYVKATDYSNAPGRYYEPWEKVVGRHKPQEVLVATKEGIVKVYPRAEALAAAKKNGVKFQNSARHEQSQADREKKEAAQKTLREARQNLAKACLDKLAAGLIKLNDKAAWKLAATMVQIHIYRDHYKLKGKTDREIVLCHLFGADDPVNWDGQWDKRGAAFWKMAGVDLSAEEQRAKAAAAKETPAQADAKKRWAKMKAKKGTR